MSKGKTIDFIKENGIIAIVRGVDVDHIVPMAEAMYAGGIRLIEVTFNQNDPDHLAKTGEIIKTLVEKVGDKICVGTGTVMNEAQCMAAYEAGANYFISPNVSVDVIKKANELGVVSIPGALTPSEAATAYEAGADFVKLFPAGNLGSGYIKSVCAPLNHIPFLAVGGINAANRAEFMKTGICGVGVGGNLVDVKAIMAGEYDKITAAAKEYTEQ
ncbi:MAG: bifunctional 4-hydroxy-2-oxoglutarate aldolase/2-dehydro-3-deoxy-phosphogluconate aldolase [Lachnospiraceae bacterium]